MFLGFALISIYLFNSNILEMHISIAANAFLYREITTKTRAISTGEPI